MLINSDKSAGPREEVKTETVENRIVEVKQPDQSLEAMSKTTQLRDNDQGQMGKRPGSNQSSTKAGNQNNGGNHFVTKNGAAIIDEGPLRIVITDSPTDFNIESHIKELVKYNVKHVCRACEPSYSTTPLTQNKIQVHDLSFPDGDPPPEHVLNQWLLLVKSCFFKHPNNAKRISNGKGLGLGASVQKDTMEPEQLNQDERISVHCVAGLGRAPVLVAVALVEFCGMEPLEAVKLIRKHRRGSINKRQLEWLGNYKPRLRKQVCAPCVIS